jgi:enterochelin esterase-like enzyme
MSRPMTKTRIATWVVLSIASMGVISAMALRPSGTRSIAEPEEGFDSLRLAALAKELKAGDQAALDRFWEELRGKAPLLEPVAESPHRSWVTFVWRGDGNTRRMNVQGGPATGDFANWMKRLGDTDLWYRTDQIPNDSRFAYFFQVNRPLRFPPHAEKLPPLAPPRADPLNPRKTASPDVSLAELPDAPSQPWLQRLPEVPGGALNEHRIISEIVRGSNPGFEHERRFVVYTPPNYDPQGRPCGLLLLFDGPHSTPDMPVPAILDHLIATGRIRPLVGVFLYQSRERLRELGCSAPFSDFVARELIPWMRKNYHISHDPHHTTISGFSAGGRMAAYCGLRHSEVFGNVLSLSGGFEWWPGALEERMDEEPAWLTRQFVTARRVPSRFYLAAGRFEHWFFPSSLLTENRRLRDVLQAKGYSVHYSEFSGGHHPVCWRSPFVDGLVWLTDVQKRE